MNNLKFLFVLLSFTGIIFFGCSDKSNSPVEPIADEVTLEKCPVIIHYTETHYPVEILDPGTVNVVGNKIIIKKVIIKERLEASTDLVTGFMIHKLSAVMDLTTGEGPCWGTFTAKPDIFVGGPEEWEGTYAGWRSKKPGSDTLFTLPLLVLGKGKAGQLRGVKMFLNDVITAWGTPPVGWYGGGEGYLKKTGHH
jgi:hypothetical protein